MEKNPNFLLGVSEYLEGRIIMALNKDLKADLVKKFGKDEKDTGSIEVQIAILTKEINDLMSQKDKEKNRRKCFHGDRGIILTTISKRRGLSTKFSKNDSCSYAHIKALRGSCIGWIGRDKQRMSNQ